MDVNLTNTQITLIVLLVAWELMWKMLALWRAARQNQPYWFFAILVLNTVGILPMLYLLLTPKLPETATQNSTT